MEGGSAQSLTTRDLRANPLCEQHELPPFTAERLADMTAGLGTGPRLGPEDCRKIAGTAAGPMRRLEDGLMEEWTLWLQQHPHRDAAVDVHVGTQRHFANSNATLSVVSWNTLSRTWLEKSRDDPEYVNVPSECFDWDSRARRLLAMLVTLDADLILLQEVDFAVFEASFLKPLSEVGYEGLMQNDRKRTEEQPCGNATFWKKCRLQLQWADHRSRTLIAGLRLLDGLGVGGELAVINAHLESSQAKSEARASQLHSALGKVRGTSAVILGGDFNTGSDSPLHAVLRNFEWHNHALAAAYEHLAAVSTAQATECTFAVSGGHRYAIDHLFYSHRMLRPTALLEALPEELRHKCLRETTRGLPDAHVPSDHIPIGAIFEVSPASADGPSPLALPKTKEEEIELWSSSANPLSAEQQQAWQALCAVNLRKPKGKPTAEEIQALREQKEQRLAREKDFVAGLSEEARVFLSLFKDARAVLK
eukprot:CAMPEP_0115393920 /NCGR_PEP_ID=MMETSP0271-20121206/11999_1 /TAXON_ID=71861 /ORGANISM="Scrippsiella trochoidea, Strain CCMP3099" /LENGTH=477 /DNA_ID=CAMNT_0002817575 /DNA_START=38 /DNA_END=1468 /DNA_ORIENTATION=+